MRIILVSESSIKACRKPLRALKLRRALDVSRDKGFLPNSGCSNCDRKNLGESRYKDIEHIMMMNRVIIEVVRFSTESSRLDPTGAKE